MSTPLNDRILVIDDNVSIHQDYDKILQPVVKPSGLGDMRAILFDDDPVTPTRPKWVVEHALQGEQGVELAQKARAEGRPFALVFVDMRMPPGIDGLETIQRLWRVDPALEIVICTAFSDHPWEEISARLGAPGQMLVLKKPFDTIEILQLAATLSEKWRSARENESHVASLEARVSEKTRELERQIEALGRASEEARAASRAKTDFLSNMSHEIRTPMTAILGHADLLSDSAVSPAMVAEHVGTIRRNGVFLLALINDILDLARIESGSFQVERVRLSPRKLVDDVSALMRLRAEEKGLTLDVVARGTVPGTITSDPLRLRQILINLVGNAIKFTETGSVRVIWGVEGSDASARFTAEVIDTGIGISRAAQASLFHPFSQADASTTRRFGGSGLGLSIVRHLADLLGGGIELASEEGVGSTFRFHVAAAPVAGAQVRDESKPALPARAAALEMSAATHGPALSGVRILLAEDSRDNQRLISLFLTRSGATVALAVNGQLALEMARTAQPPFDVILMDMQMPEMDGYEATRALRAAGYTRPIVALTAHAMSGDAERCLAAGVDEHHTKPVDRDQLVEVCARLARHGHVRAALPSAPGTRDPTQSRN
jgi:two-component system, sensor histidine kinase and response regulator